MGKGITFDSGGLCIKPAGSMLTMKSDMAGAAAVAATVLAAAELGGPVAVTGYLCLAENMPSGTAQRPGDVVTMRNGTTVEIIDTDAEGRMVLGDGLCLASEAKPDVIVDIATLTGAQMVALGSRVAGVMGNDDAFRTRGRRGRGQPRARTRGRCRCRASCAPGSTRSSPTSRTRPTAGAACSPPGSSSRSSSARASRGPTSTSPARRSTRRAPDGAIPKGGTGYGVATLVRPHRDPHRLNPQTH